MREAFDHAIDRKQIVDVVFLGNAKPGELDHPDGDRRLGTIERASRRAFDLAKANSILDGLGYKKGAGRDPRRERLSRCRTR